MSVDFDVFSVRAATENQRRDLLAQDPVLAIEAESEDFVGVSRSQDQTHLFTLDGPIDVEDEDADVEMDDFPEVTDMVPGVRYVYNIVADSDDPEPAWRFAERLATALDGVVMDNGSGDVWAPPPK